VTTPEVEKTIWQPQNSKCMYLHSQTRYQRNSNGYNYVFGVRLLIGTHECTIRPNLKLKNPRWRPNTLKCMYLHSKMRYQQNSNSYTYMFPVSGFPLAPSRKLCDRTRSGKKQYGRLYTSNECFFTPRQDNDEIPTVIPMFSGSGFLLEPIGILCDQTGSGKIQVANHRKISAFRRGITRAWPAIEDTWWVWSYSTLSEPR